MLSAKSDVQVDTPEVRVTEWRLAPGSATGHHIHEMDYVIVPVRSANISPSSWTIRASPRRSTPAWSRPKTARATTSSGPAATAIEAKPTKESRSRAGLRHVHGR